MAKSKKGSRTAKPAARAKKPTRKKRAVVAKKRATVGRVARSSTHPTAISVNDKPPQSGPPLYQERGIDQGSPVAACQSNSPNKPTPVNSAVDPKTRR